MNLDIKTFDHIIAKLIGQRIAHFRRLAGLSRHELAQEIGVGYEELRSIERGWVEPDAEVQERLGRVLHVIPQLFHIQERSSLLEVEFAELSSGNRRNAALLRSFASIKDHNVQLTLLRMVRAIAADQ